MSESEYLMQAHRRLSKGYVNGGLRALREAYPKRYAEVENELARNFTKDGIDEWCEEIMKGLKKVGYWRE
jgi:hypothetical protein